MYNKYVFGNQKKIAYDARIRFGGTNKMRCTDMLLLLHNFTCYQYTAKHQSIYLMSISNLHNSFGIFISTPVI